MHALVALMDDIARDTQRASEVVRRVRNFVRTGTAEREPVDLRRTVQEVLHIVAGEARETATALNTDLPADPVTVHGDPVQLAQVLLNLVRNAKDSITASRAGPMPASAQICACCWRSRRRTGLDGCKLLWWAGKSFSQSH